MVDIADALNLGNNETKATMVWLCENSPKEFKLEGSFRKLEHSWCD